MKREGGVEGGGRRRGRGGEGRWGGGVEGGERGGGRGDIDQVINKMFTLIIITFNRSESSPCLSPKFSKRWFI